MTPTSRHGHVYPDEIILGLVVAAIIVLIFICVRPSAGQMVDPARLDFPAGTVLVSRNLDEDLNTSPGYWNHLASIDDAGDVIEAQEGQGVIRTPLAEYIGRDYEWFPLFPRSRAVGRRAAESADGMVGLPYRKPASLRPRLLMRSLPIHNCTSQVREMFEDATRRRMQGLFIPDHILRFPDLFTTDEDEVGP